MKELTVLENNFNQLIEDVRNVLRFDTVKSQALPNAPFGEGNAKCLNYVLELCRSYGGEICNVDNYAGHADFGKGEQIFGILGHLDVVPANEDSWIAPPFGAEIINDRIYARGALDDKAPMIACLYAVKSLVEAGYTFRRKVRLIFGCDEETSMSCVKHYFKKIAPPDLAISPDADFPVINREKGIIDFAINCGKLDDRILDVNGGLRPNVVMDKCVAKVKDVDEKLLDGVEYIVDNGVYTITTRGKSAHGSQPERGDNAFWKMAEILYKLTGDATLQTVCKKMTDYTGKNWGVDTYDELSGHLTCNVGIVRYENNILVLIIDCRHPITFVNKQIIDKFVANTPFDVTVLTAKEPLNVPEESELVQSLLKAYTKATGNKGYTIAIGGGTYSRALSNCVAFGPEFPDDTEAVIHQPNEFISLTNLKKMTQIYMEAIKQICCE